MIDLHKEAEEYAKTKYSFIITKETDLAEAAAYIIAINDYKAGATSKYVQAEKLKAQIEVLKELAHEDKSISTNFVSIYIGIEQQLSKLENEND